MLKLMACRELPPTSKVAAIVEHCGVDTVRNVGL